MHSIQSDATASEDQVKVGTRVPASPMFARGHRPVQQTSCITSVLIQDFHVELT
jgi:predicted secreted protein